MPHTDGFPMAVMEGSTEDRIAAALERIAAALEAQAAAASFLDQALQPSADADGSGELSLDTLDWYRTSDGAFRIRTPDGDREPAPAEAAVLRSAVKPRGERRH